MPPPRSTMISFSLSISFPLVHYFFRYQIADPFNDLIGGPMQAEEDEALKDKLEATERTRLRRFPVRGQFDRGTINSILDTTPIGHIGFNNYDDAAILPMVFWRTGNHVYFHGSAKNRMFKALAKVRQCCFVANSNRCLCVSTRCATSFCKLSVSHNLRRSGGNIRA